MNDAKVRRCLLAIVSINHGLMVASEGNATIDNLGMGITALLQMGGEELERVSHDYPVRMVVLDELETQELVPVETDKKVTS